VENPLYHVLLEGRTVGPYDRRTIVGMRIKKALTSADVVVAAGGARLTVADLLRKERPDSSFQASHSGSYSVVQAQHAAALVEAEEGAFAVPLFKGEVEVRVQTKALRIAGRHRQGMAWKDDRVKIPLEAVAHARARGSLVDVALRVAPGEPLQRIALELFTPDAAADLVDCLHPAAPWPEPAAASRRRPVRGPHPMVWAAVVGTAIAVGTVLVWVLTRGL
jgi:hypothetical protein